MEQRTFNRSAALMLLSGVVMILTGCLTLDSPQIPEVPESPYHPTTAEVRMIIADLHCLVERCAGGEPLPDGVTVETSVTPEGNLLFAVICDAYTSDTSEIGYDGRYELETSINSYGGLDTMRTSISLVVYGSDLGGQIAFDLDMIYDILQDQYIFICCHVNGIQFDQNMMELLIRQEL